MKVDFNKKITQILYNHLNLPVEIIFEGSSQKKITYIYTATGQKIQKIILAPSMVEKTTHYLNGLQYFQSRLQFIPTSEGYVNATTIRGNYRFNYVYNYLDHLGNVRLSYGRDPQARNEIKILEENHYYPYGLKHTNYNANLNAFKKDNNDQVQLTGTGLSADLINKYKFNGMEYQDELGLNLYDMDMRDYDPAIGRWLGIDPVTHFDESPYMGMSGNPVFWADPSGADGVVGDPTGTVYGMAGQTSSVSYGIGHIGFWGSAKAQWEQSYEAHEEAKQLAHYSIKLNGGELEISKSGKISIWNWRQEEAEFGIENQLKTGSVRVLKDMSADNIFAQTFYHFQVGGGKPIAIRASSLKLSAVTQRNLIYNPKSNTYDLDLYNVNPRSQEALALGKISLINQGNNQFSINKDTYDFNIEWQRGLTKRNIATAGAGYLHYGGINALIPIIFGGPFDIYFAGTITIKK